METMNMGTIIAYIGSGLSLLGAWSAIGKDIMPILTQLQAVVASGSDPTASDWQALLVAEQSLRAKLNA